MAAELERRYWEQGLICINSTFKCQSIELAVSIKPRWRLLLCAKDGTALPRLSGDPADLSLLPHRHWTLRRRLRVELITGTQIYHISIQHYHLPNLSFSLTEEQPLIHDIALNFTLAAVVCCLGTSLGSTCTHPACVLTARQGALAVPCILVQSYWNVSGGNHSLLSVCMPGSPFTGVQGTEEVSVPLHLRSIIQLDKWFSAWESYTEILLR